MNKNIPRVFPEIFGYNKLIPDNIRLDSFPVLISKEEYKLRRDRSLFDKDGKLSIGYKIYETEYERN